MGFRCGPGALDVRHTNVRHTLVCRDLTKEVSQETCDKLKCVGHQVFQTLAGSNTSKPGIIITQATLAACRDAVEIDSAVQKFALPQLKR
jgi:hypothetical protein